MVVGRHPRFSRSSVAEGEGLIVTDRFTILQRRALRQRKRIVRDSRQPDRVRYGLIDLADGSRRAETETAPLRKRRLKLDLTLDDVERRLDAEGRR
jgi:hypothetical protein